MNSHFRPNDCGMNSGLCKTVTASECKVSVAEMTQGGIHKSWPSEADLLVVLCLIVQRNRLLFWIVI